MFDRIYKCSKRGDLDFRSCVAQDYYFFGVFYTHFGFVLSDTVDLSLYFTDLFIFALFCCVTFSTLLKHTLFFI